MKELRPAIIRMYQNGIPMREISRFLDAPKSTVINDIKRFEKTVLTHVYGVAKAIRERMANFIRVPSSPEEWLSIAKDFERRTCLPNCLDAVGRFYPVFILTKRWKTDLSTQAG
jgi:DNA-binding Lrp family transcriptional regulator